MAEVIELIDGTTAICAEPPEAFLEKLIDKRLGSEARAMFCECIQSLKDENAWNEKCAMDNELVADGYRNQCVDAMRSFQELRALLEEPRLNRTKLQKHTDLAYNDLYKNL